MGSGKILVSERMFFCFCCAFVTGRTTKRSLNKNRHIKKEKELGKKKKKKSFCFDSCFVFVLLLRGCLGCLVLLRL